MLGSPPCVREGCWGPQEQRTAVDLAKANFHIEVVGALHAEIKKVGMRLTYRGNTRRVLWFAERSSD
jgi:hypothetical protein